MDNQPFATGDELEAAQHLVDVWRAKEYPGDLPGSESLPSQNPTYLFARDLEVLKVRLHDTAAGVGPGGPAQTYAGVVCVEGEVVGGEVVRAFADLMDFSPEHRAALRWARLHDRPEWNSL